MFPESGLSEKFQIGLLFGATLLLLASIVTVAAQGPQTNAPAFPHPSAKIWPPNALGTAIS